jgi:hypothetical protein
VGEFRAADRRHQNRQGAQERQVDEKELIALTWYEATRHSFTNRMLEAGASLDEVNAAPGHSSPVVTRRYYDHFIRRSFSPLVRGGLGIAPATVKATIIHIGKDVSTGREKSGPKKIQTPGGAPGGPGVRELSLPPIRRGERFTLAVPISNADESSACARSPRSVDGSRARLRSLGGHLGAAVRVHAAEPKSKSPTVTKTGKGAALVTSVLADGA